ncbi:hypothetical protein MGI18_17975 [Bacillus sp. OVS6]|nr:hypothetical protein MGI18_17975 [Bacillus sp. OVS6]
MNKSEAAAEKYQECQATPFGEEEQLSPILKIIYGIEWNPDSTFDESGAMLSL